MVVRPPSLLAGLFVGFVCTLAACAGAAGLAQAPQLEANGQLEPRGVLDGLARATLRTRDGAVALDGLSPETIASLAQRQLWVRGTLSRDRPPPLNLPVLRIEAMGMLDP